jgi:mRNA-degrading endonuclease RelE of RelBE toxin-antitoxin system
MLLFTKTFVRDYRKLPQDIQELMDKQLGLFLSNPKHPSLNMKKCRTRATFGNAGLLCPTVSLFK